jgi:predicted phage terminase large subunit-like protein
VPGRDYVEQEPGSGGKESADATIANLAGFAVYADRPTGSKDVRLEPFAAQAEAGNVRLLRGAWNQDYVEELCAVPNGAYRDQADATAGAFNKLAGGRRRPDWDAEIVE